MSLEKKVEKCLLEKKNWHGITITDSAAQQICRLMANDSSMLGVRLRVKQSGCASFGYVVEKVLRLETNDQIYEHNGAKLYVPINTMPFIDGTELDYVQKGLNNLFTFNNPKAKHVCGCGESFSL